MQALQRHQRFIVYARQYILKPMIRTCKETGRSPSPGQNNKNMFCTVGVSSMLYCPRKQCNSSNIHPCRPHDRPSFISRPIKHFCSLQEPLTADQVFSESMRQEMLCRLSALRVPRSLFRTITKHASILVPLCTVEGEPGILLTLRSYKLTHHKGEVSFPGGIQDETDEDAVATALREAQEELGIQPEDVDVWCQMDAVPNKTRETAVVPVVGFIGEVDVSKLQINQHEVECAFTIPLSTILDPNNQRYTRFIPRQFEKKLKVLTRPYTLPVFDGGLHRVWGLSAIVLDLVLQAWLPQYYTSFMVKQKLFRQK